MTTEPDVILTGFADEAAIQKTAHQQFAAFAALGLRYYTLRFIDAGKGIKNVMQLNQGEIQQIRQLQSEYGLSVSSLGTPLGKVKLLDVDDKSNNTYVPFDQYLDREVRRACELAHAFEVKLLRGFSFYAPRDSNPWDHIPQVVDQIGKIVDVCDRNELSYGIEVEANLVGQNGQILAEIHRQVNHDGLLLVFDAGNLITQGYSAEEVYQQYLSMKSGLGWIHVKDYRPDRTIPRGAHVDEESLRQFVPADIGHSGYEAILSDFKLMLPDLMNKLQRRGVPGIFMDMEPHLRSGGQFGGHSGPDGMGVALRGLCRVLDRVGISYHLRDFGDIVKARGF